MDGKGMWYTYYYYELGKCWYYLTVFTFFILDFTLAYLQKHGFGLPILFKDKTGLGLHVPSPNFSVNDVRTCVGECNNYQYSRFFKYLF